MIRRAGEWNALLKGYRRIYALKIAFQIKVYYIHLNLARFLTAARVGFSVSRHRFPEKNRVDNRERWRKKKYADFKKYLLLKISPYIIIIC